MNRKKRIKRTTLLIIGVILLWSSVAIWNEVHKLQINHSIGQTSFRTNPSST
ncbi:hypothetical protein [Paenibacillus ferrarius]|uniref:hypothetical protein n=1 Tax=Paenibacillus ferrarius TaxID=1469647 RepID=UPI003D2DA7EB